MVCWRGGEGEVGECRLVDVSGRVLLWLWLCLECVCVCIDVLVSGSVSGK